MFTPLLRQYVVVFAANLSLIVFGMAVAWLSPAIVKLRNINDTVLSQPVTDEEVSWIVSTSSLCNVFANFITAYLADRVGRKFCIMISCIPKITACFIYIFATEVWMLLLSRVLDGFSESLVLIVVPMYTAEIANKETRGALGTIFQFCCSLGIVIILSVGPYTTYVQMNIIYLVLSVLVAIPVIFLPDSPYYLYKKGHKNKSKEVLLQLRGSETLVNEEIKEYIRNENCVNVIKLKYFKDRSVLKSLVLVAFLGFGNQFTGYNAISNYLQTILTSVQTSVAPEIASVIIGLIQLLSSVFTSLTSDSWGRKPILISTLFGIAVGMCGMGIFFIFVDKGFPVVGFLNFLPLASLALIVFCYGSGMGSLYWPLISELLDSPARATGVSISLTMNTFTQFIITKYFISLTATIGSAFTYWIFSANCIFVSLVIYFFIPETMNKSFSEVQQDLKGKSQI